ncbi:MAG: glutathione S-transferase family protein [Alphaproteobacteria bacterium]
MSEKLTVYGFEASTYVRTVRMVLAEKDASYDLVPVDLEAGENTKPEHLARHPFGKIPTIEHGRKRLYETSAITRYLNDALPGTSLAPDGIMDRARMDMCLAIHDSYGYGALVGLAAQHLFPEFVGGKNEEMRLDCLQKSRLVLTEIMKLRGDSPWIAGAHLSLADCFVAPVCFYVSLTGDAGTAFDVPGFADWWARVQKLESYAATEPDLG